MITRHSLPRRTARPARPALAGLGVAAALLASCGGSDLENPATTSNGRLAFAYYQKCIDPILRAQLTVNLNGAVSINSCASAGCHDSVSGTGGALRVTAAAAPVSLADSPDAIRASDMYRNYYSSQGVTVIGAPTQSRLLTKPQVLGVLHGGGLIFTDPQDENVRRLQYWISRPAPQGQDEFSTATYTMFTPNDPATGTCNTQ